MLRPIRGTFAALVLCALVALVSTGCMTGLVYTHTTLPLDTDLDHTPAHQGERGESWKSLVLPIVTTNVQLRFDWGDASIAGAMAEAGIETVHYADLETRSFLGIWTQRWIHVYGE